MNSSPMATATTLSNSAEGRPTIQPHASAQRPSRAARTVLALLGKLRHGTLDLAHAHETHRFHGAKAETATDSASRTPHASLRLHDEAVFARVLQSGDIGLAEAYVDGQWSSPELRELLELFMRNRDSLERAVYGSRLGTLAYRLTHWMRRNSRRGSRRNIEAHYDLGNDFYAAWLDPTMNYSGAWFDGAASLTLPEAQQRKVGRALDEAGIGRGSSLLEIGCGWGAVAETAARRGADVVGVTLSHEQLAYARQRLRATGGEAHADLRLQDYRDLAQEGRRYDGIVSIEMFEAVGRAYWPGYFETLRRCLHDDGRACVQVIVIRDDLFERYVRSTDFIQQYIFPGGLLPSAAIFRAEAAKAGLEVVNELEFGNDYARTLEQWRHTFHERREHIASLGYDERFLRLWDFYLAYCEAAFTTGQTDVMQFTLRHAPTGTGGTAAAPR